MPSTVVRRTEIWHGFIYVNLDGKAKPLAPRLKSLEPFVQNHHMEEMLQQFTSEEVWPANWKCLVENFMEGYHLSTLHYNEKLEPLHKMLHRDRVLVRTWRRYQATRLCRVIWATSPATIQSFHSVSRIMQT